MNQIQRDDATEAQVRAADPFGSTWLAANAGSGKTRVLTDRVARLLLRDVDPQHILCLTYTKAAATEMQNRLFKRLGEWAMSPDDTLSTALAELGEEQAVSADDLIKARTLFARAIEAPGGLKIQTIHSFCSSLLRRFPLEAGVSPQFQEMEERAAELLRADIVDNIAQGTDAGTLRMLAEHFTGESLSRLTAEIVRFQASLSHPVTWEEIAQAYGAPVQFDAAFIKSTLFIGGEAALLEQLIPAMSASGPTDQEVAKKLQAISSLDETAYTILRDTLLTAAGTPSKRNPGKAVREALPDVVDLMDRVAAVLEAQRTYDGARKTLALRQFAVPFLRAYDQAKREQGWLDFDDLILKTRALLSDSQVAAWVLYRLDGGIRHILVDEAQDTSPAQWDVIRKLAEEFTSGQGTLDDEPRTIFVVGDKKQSIYSFQGADPDEFDRMEAEFADKLRALNTPLLRLSLDYSFRSSDAVLRTVDETFVGKESAGFATELQHRAFHGDKPGRVDLWPLVEKADTPDETEWYDPVDRKADTHHDLVLAGQVAKQIALLLDAETPGLIPEKADGAYQMRPVTAGDIMVLVQRRSTLFHEIIRECKKLGLPIAGADRLRVGGELAVRDLLALLSFLATPEDSLSLAAVLRSPLAGWSERDLFQLAHQRKETHLWETLRNKRENHATTYAMLEDLRGHIDFLRPYDLLERILTRHRGRERLLARLGQEAEDGIDAILSQALGYERSTIPSLTGFLTWAKADNLEIKRQVDSAGDLIRVMTVHGAKGLEAPIVILPDCRKQDLRIRDEILLSDHGPIWKTRSDDSPAFVTQSIDARKNADARERLRLLYVALTRAETWLIVAAAGDLDKEGNDWYQLVQRGLRAQGAVPHDFPIGEGLRYEFGDWTVPLSRFDVPQVADLPALHPVLTSPISKVPNRDDPLSPSDLGDVKSLASETGLGEDIAMARGTYIHVILERLPQLQRNAWDSVLASIPVPRQLPSEVAEQARIEALDTLNATELAWVFAPDALAEVSVSGHVRGQVMQGIIDRLIIREDKVLIIDFKSNLTVPGTPEDCPEAILRQMGAYAQIVGQIYPDKDIETGIVWTVTQAFMSVPKNIVMDALARAIPLDAAQVGP